MGQEVMNRSQNNRPLLSICVPIYNRLSFLKMMLERFMEDKSLFEKKIELIISDNCSKEDLLSCVTSFQKQGLNVFYHRQERNLGPDGNFNYCFKQAHGEYMWLLGSDDIPVSGIIKGLISHLEGKDFGLLYLGGTREKTPEYIEYDDNNEILVDINVMISFMSANIIRTDNLNNLNLMKYSGTNLIQVPAFIDACLNSKKNAMWLVPQIYEPISDTATTGDYDLFGVMITNLFGICQEFVDDGRLKKKEFERFKKAEYEWVCKYILAFLILRWRSNYFLGGAWNTIFKHYGKYPYAYVLFPYYCLKAIIMKIIR